MQNQFINDLLASFYLFLDHEILVRGNAYTNYSGLLYNTPDPFFAQYSVWGSPFRQWVNDTSINGASVPSGVFAGGTFLPRGTSGLNLDFSMGRAIFSGSVNASNSFTTNYAFKDINLYYTNQTEEKILFDSEFSLNPKNDINPTGALDWRSQPFPSIYIKLKNSDNAPYAFGGLDSTNTSIRSIIVSDSNFLLDAVSSIMNDTARKVFSNIPNNQLPFNIFGDYKSGNSYNYMQLSANNLTGANIVYINKVLISKFDSYINKRIGRAIYAGFVDFEVSNIRSPRVY